QKPTQLTTEQYALQVSPDRVDLVVVDEHNSSEFRDKVEAARTKASRSDPLTPFPLGQPKSPSDRQSPPAPVKSSQKNLKRKEIEKSKCFRRLFTILF